MELENLRCRLIIYACVNRAAYGGCRQMSLVWRAAGAREDMELDGAKVGGVGSAEGLGPLLRSLRNLV